MRFHACWCAHAIVTGHQPHLSVRRPVLEPSEDDGAAPHRLQHDYRSHFDTKHRFGRPCSTAAIAFYPSAAAAAAAAATAAAAVFLRKLQVRTSAVSLFGPSPSSSARWAWQYCWA